MKFVILMPIVVFFLREPSIAHNINGIRVTNSKKNIYYVVNKEGTKLPIKVSTSFAMPQFKLSSLCPALHHLLANNLSFFFLFSFFLYQITHVRTKKKQQN